MNYYNPVGTTVLDAILELAPEVAARADEIEAGRGIPADLMGKLKAAGIFRMLVPKAYGGEELHPVEACRALEALSRADGSAGWNAMVALGFNVVFAHLAPDMAAEVFANGPDVLTRGALAPKGVAIPTDGGYVIKGRWPLASGSFEPTWVVGHCIVLENGQPKMGPNGAPEMVLALLRPDQVQFLDTWDAVGLRGSASHDFVVNEQFVPIRQTASLFGPSHFQAPPHGLPFYMIAAPTHAAVTLGIAQGALDDVAALAKTKRPAMNPAAPLGDDPIFNYKLGELAARLQAARAYLEAGVEATWRQATSGEEVTPLNSSAATAMAAYVQHQCQDIVDAAFTLAGSNACYNSFLLQRRWRDVRCAVQHTAASTNSYAQLGNALVAAA